MSSAMGQPRVVLGPTFREQIWTAAVRTSDLVAMGLALAAALAIRETVSAGSLISPVSASTDVLLALTLLLSANASFAALGLSPRPLPRTTRSDVPAIALATALPTLALAAVGWSLSSGRVTAALLALVWGGSTVLALGGRLLLWTLVRRLHGSRLAQRNVLVLGSGPRAIRYAQEVEASPESGVRLIGFADDDWPGLDRFRGTGRNLLSDLKNFSAFLRDNVVDEVVVALPFSVLHRSKFDPIGDALEQGLTLRVVTCAIDDLQLGAIQLGPVATRVAVSRFSGRVEGWGLVVKRCIDLAVSAGLLVALAPLFGLVAAAVRFGSPGPIFFFQERVGLNGRTFRMYKFRTMRVDAEEMLDEVVRIDELEDPMFKLRQDPRVTKVGRLLRRISVDEVPQLFNVLVGEMGIVGPRPEQVEIVERYSPEDRFRLTVKPGITGPMQVFGRGELTFSERLAVELEYVENPSLARDVRIVLHTVPAVIRGTGAF